MQGRILSAPFWLDEVTIPHPTLSGAPFTQGSLPSGNPISEIRILRCAQNDIGLSLRAFGEGVAIRSLFTAKP